LGSIGGIICAALLQLRAIGKSARVGRQGHFFDV
jgi:hypothetical protein